MRCIRRLDAFGTDWHRDADSSPNTARPMPAACATKAAETEADRRAWTHHSGVGRDDGNQYRFRTSAACGREAVVSDLSTLRRQVVSVRGTTGVAAAAATCAAS